MSVLNSYNTETNKMLAFQRTFDLQSQCERLPHSRGRTAIRKNGHGSDLFPNASIPRTRLGPGSRDALG